MATPEWVKRELRENYAKATRAGRRAARVEPRAAAELGRMGGRRSSDAKAAAARKNGRKGGRPRSRPMAAADA